MSGRRRSKGCIAQNGTLGPKGSFPDDEDRLMKKAEAATKLVISMPTLEHLVGKGAIEKMFVGGAPRFRWSEISQIGNRVFENSAVLIFWGCLTA